MSQLNLIPYETISQQELAEILYQIRGHYWHVRSLRHGCFGQAKLRGRYRQVEKLKRRLLLAGIEKRDVLDFLACCRLKCVAKKQPFLYCKYCGDGRNADLQSRLGSYSARGVF